MAPVFAPFTENSTVQHNLKLSQEASHQVNQLYTVVTFDLAVAKKAYALVWQNPDTFGNVIVRMGSFHLLCAYIAALGKVMKCSGFEEILVESGICASGSIAQVINGKHYNRALRVHKIVQEASERILLHLFEQQQDPLPHETTVLLSRVADDPSEKKMSSALTDNGCKELLQTIQNGSPQW